MRKREQVFDPCCGVCVAMLDLYVLYNALYMLSRHVPLHAGVIRHPLRFTFMHCLKVDSWVSADLRHHSQRWVSNAAKHVFLFPCAACSNSLPDDGPG